MNTQLNFRFVAITTLAILLGALASVPRAGAQETDTSGAPTGASESDRAAPAGSTDPDEPQETDAESASDADEESDTDAAGEIEPDSAARFDPEITPPDSIDPDETIEEMVVTGTVTESSQDLINADSVEEFSPEDLAALGADNIADLAAFTPNLEIVTTGGTTPTFFIRGVGLNDFNANSTSAVSVYQDDVHVNSPALQLGTLFDVSGVNILRGPQGYRSFRNASAGAIKVYSRKPSGGYGGFYQLDLGNIEYMRHEGAFEAPIVEDILSTRLAFTVVDRGGLMKNRCAGAPLPADRVGYVPGPIGDPDGLGPTGGPWSHCGENVQRTTRVPGGPGVGGWFSNVPPGLPEYVNTLGRWAARGTFLFEPTLDLSFLVIGRGSRLNELTSLGQAYGVNGFTCLDGDTSNNCNRPYPVGSRINGVLGGTDSALYRQQEVTDRLVELEPCSIRTACPPSQRGAANDAKNQVAQELSDGLDSLPWEGDFDRAGRTTNDTWGATLQGDFELPKGLLLNSVSSYDSYNRSINIDLDFTPNELFEVKTDDNLWQFFQDLELEGTFGDWATGYWDLGGYFLYEDLNVAVENNFGENTEYALSNRVYNQRLTSGAVYANLSVDFWEDFNLDGGIRWNLDHKEMDYSITQATVDIEQQLSNTWQAPTGGVRLTYRFANETEAYWKYTRGWKGGHYNATGSTLSGVTVAEPETNDAFEIGMRGSYLDDRLQLNMSLFWYNYQNYQIFTAQQFLGGAPEFLILNANDAEVYGAEIDMQATPWEGAFWSVGFGWLETQFLDFVIEQQDQDSSGFPFTRELQNSGNPLLNSPRFKVAMTFEQTIWLGRWGSLIPRYDGAWTDTTYYDATKGRGIPNQQGLQYLPESTIGQRAFFLHNLRLTYRLPGDQVEVALWVRNMTDQVYKTFAFDGSTFQQTSIYFLGDPRTFGGTVSFFF